MNGPALWSGCRIAVFDVDGTLYDQKPLQRRMMAQVILHALGTVDFRLPLLIASLRKERERLAESEHEDFAPELVQRVARRHGVPVDSVEKALTEWFDRRPLRYIGKHAAPGLPALFAGLRRSGIRIGILSDYPAADKLEVLGLSADLVVSATDSDVRRLKPHPKGLTTLLDRAGHKPDEAVVIGDRADRDGAIAARVGARFLLRGRGPEAHFWRYDDAVFAPIIAR